MTAQHRDRRPPTDRVDDEAPSPEFQQGILGDVLDVSEVHPLFDRAPSGKPGGAPEDGAPQDDAATAQRARGERADDDLPASEELGHA